MNIRLLTDRWVSADTPKSCHRRLGGCRSPMRTRMQNEGAGRSMMYGLGVCLEVAERDEMGHETQDGIRLRTGWRRYSKCHCQRQRSLVI